MCCNVTETLDLPPPVIEAIAEYRRLHRERAFDWGDEGFEFFRLVRFARYASVVAEFGATRDWAKAVRAGLGRDLPAGVVAVRIDEGGGLTAEVGPTLPAISGHRVALDVLIDSAADAEVTVTVAGQPVRVEPAGAAVVTVSVDGGDPSLAVEVEGSRLVVSDVVERRPTATLRLVSPRCVRWSVTDAVGGGWFAGEVLPKWDFHHRPFFHGHDVMLEVPAGELRVACTRGLEFESVEQVVTPAPGATVTVEADPVRRFDPAADGWYGGDLHVHMNYSGDLVCTPGDAARMQLGEGLHLMNLVAANALTSLVYERDMLEQYPGQELPWSTPEGVAQMGVEYRNDLLGHVHALGPSAPPSRYYTGHDRSDHPEDWPPNSVACEELHGLGATIGYCHPSMSEFPQDGSTRRFFRNPRSVEARELVADAALGLVDSVDLIAPGNDEGAVFLYHRLLSCGLRLATSVGTDVFLSFGHSGTFSNPPGWGRVYAHLGGRPLSVEAFKDAIRAGRTVITNGPWITLDVNGAGPGEVLDLQPGDRLHARAEMLGPARKLTIVGPEGVLAEGDDAQPELSFEAELDDRGTWIAAIARGPGDLTVLEDAALAHTTPVYVDVAGRRVARAADARWCLDFLDTFEAFAAEHGHFEPATREAHFGALVAVLDKARAYYRERA